MINIYVGNLPYKTVETDLADLFGRFGTVERATIVKDRETGRSRGFGFVEMTDHAAGTEAIETLLQEEFNGRPLTINEARPRGGASGGTGGTGGSGGAGGAGGAGASVGGASTGAAASRGPRTSFGNSIGYSNQLAGDSSEELPKPPAPKPAGPTEDQPPVSRGYTNEFLDR